MERFVFSQLNFNLDLKGKLESTYETWQLDWLSKCLQRTLKELFVLVTEARHKTNVLQGN